ncbi:MAG TPA: glycosyltransferase family 39 protein [Terracidiphilus sp.]|nr:glycosyltransferase family 39 protein [Terracidiphilus sp.]
MSQSNRISSKAAASVALALAAGLALRLWMLARFFEVSGDSLVYGGIAKNLLLHGRYALTFGAEQMFSTLIRLPGYPIYLAGCFKLFGIDNYAPAVWVQIVLDLAGCLLVADCARRVAQERWRGAAFHGSLWLAAMCPFTAIYAVSPLTETLTLFALALALWAMVRFREQQRWASALTFTFAVTLASLLRPDGALVAVALAPALLVGARGAELRARLRMALVCALLAAAPFAAWTWRNWQVFRVVQPLAPKSATDPGDQTTPGWDLWVKTWCLDFVSTYSVAWNVPGDTLDLNQLPTRAFDSDAQRAETEALAAKYNGNGFNLMPEIDAGFARLAEERIHAHPLRYYIGLPTGRVVDMWLRPRVENLPIDLDWWNYARHHAETRFSWFYVALNLVYVGLGVAGLCLRPRLWPWLAGYMVLRSVMLLTIVPPEARYTLECFPILFVLGGAAIAQLAARFRSVIADH